MSDIVEVMALASCVIVGDSPACERACDGCKKHARAALAALEAAGLAVVPVVPTREMIEAGNWNPWEGTSDSFAAIGWEYMVKASNHPAADTAGPTRPSEQDA